MTSPKLYAHTSVKSATASSIHHHGFGGWIRLRKCLAGLLFICGCPCCSRDARAAQLELRCKSCPTPRSPWMRASRYKFTASVANDIHNQGVTWSLTQSSACSGSGCGTLMNVTNSSVTYVAPSNLTAALSVTLTAASISQSTATTTAAISIVVAPTFTTTTLPGNAANGVPYNGDCSHGGSEPSYVLSPVRQFPSPGAYAEFNRQHRRKTHCSDGESTDAAIFIHGAGYR